MNAKLWRQDWSFPNDSVLIVTGGWIGAARYDRALAYLIRYILKTTNIPADVMDDKAYFTITPELDRERPLICIGGPKVNALTAHFFKGIKPEVKLKNMLTNSKTGQIAGLADVICTEKEYPVALVFGPSVPGTYEQVTRFLQDSYDLLLADDASYEVDEESEMNRFLGAYAQYFGIKKPEIDLAKIIPEKLQLIEDLML